MTSLAHVPHSTPVRSGGDSDIPYRGFRRTPIDLRWMLSGIPTGVDVNTATKRQLRPNFTDDHLTSLSRRNCRGGFGRPGFPLTHGLEQASHGASRRDADMYGFVNSLVFHANQHGAKRCEALRGRTLQTFAENGERTWAKP